MTCRMSLYDKGDISCPVTIQADISNVKFLPFLLQNLKTIALSPRIAEMYANAVFQGRIQDLKTTLNAFI